MLLLLESMTANSAAPLLLQALGWSLAGVMMWVSIELLYRRLYAHVSQVPVPLPLNEGTPSSRRFPSKSALAQRVILFVLSAAASAIVWQNTDGNRIDPPVMALWLASAVLWSCAFANFGWKLSDWSRLVPSALGRFSWRTYGWALLAFAGVMALGAVFRLAQLDTLPRDMVNADHTTDILGAYRIAQGEFQIFLHVRIFQETMHLYLTALFAALPGLGFDHFTLKLVSGLESLATLPLLFWLGIEIAGRRNCRWGVALGLVISGLVAVSYWHVVITRYAMRTHLTTLFAALTMIYLIRAMRENRRSDFIKLGLALGFSMYGYIACRMLLLAAIAGIGLAILIRQVSLVCERLRYIANLAMACWIGFMVYLPMHHASLEYTAPFAGKILEVMFEARPGEPIPIDLDMFLTGLMANFRDVFLMFHWIGDHHGIQAAPFKPALDVFTGSFLILGLSAWLARVLQTPRDPVWWFLPVMILIMMLPSTLSVAHSANNPSNTRVSGAIPAIYLLASLPIVRIAFLLLRQLPRRLGRSLAVAFCALVLLLAFQRNSYVYFNLFASQYMPAPTSHVGARHARLGSGRHNVGEYHRHPLS